MILKCRLMGMTEKDNPGREGIQIFDPLRHFKQKVGRAVEVPQFINDRLVMIDDILARRPAAEYGVVHEGNFFIVQIRPFIL